MHKLLCKKSVWKNDLFLAFDLYVRLEAYLHIKSSIWYRNHFETQKGWPISVKVAKTFSSFVSEQAAWQSLGVVQVFIVSVNDLKNSPKHV